MSLYTLKEKNIYKSLLIMAIFFALVGGIGWLASLYFGNSFIFYGAIVFALIMNFYSYWNAHKTVLKATGAQEIQRNRETEQLYDIVENLAITANIPTPKIYLINDPSPNAFATGRSPKYGTVAVTKGLLAVLDKNELEGVIAHELSHIQNRDTLVMTVVFALAGIVAILSDFMLHSALFRGNHDRNPLLLVGVVIGALLTPLAATLLQLGVSRKREFVADASAALLTRYPEGLASALEKIQQHSTPLQKKQHSVAHFFISDPYKAGIGSQKKKTSFTQRLFSTHPPTEVRIERLRKSM